jgi:hypothetical protein
MTTGSGCEWHKPHLSPVQATTLLLRLPRQHTAIPSTPWGGQCTPQVRITGLSQTPFICDEIRRKELDWFNHIKNKIKTKHLHVLSLVDGLFLFDIIYAHFLSKRVKIVYQTPYMCLKIILRYFLVPPSSP